MTTAVSGCRVDLREPRRAEVRSGESVSFAVDLAVPEPWLERPRLGREVRTIDGAGLPDLSWALELDRDTTVPALISGTAQVRDTRIDVHTPSGFPDAGAGRGVEVAIAASGVEVVYGHLARGSTKSGLVRSGEAIGRGGNTGRCVDGCGKSFVSIELRGFRLSRSLDDVFTPIEVALYVEGKREGAAVRISAGETQIRGLAVASFRPSRDRGDRLACEVRVTRRGSLLGSTRLDLAVRI